MRRPLASRRCSLMLFAAIALATAAGCRKPEEDADVLPPAGWSPTPPVVTSPVGPARFGSGWFAIESNAQGNWRWMGQSGEIHLPSVPTKARLEVVGWAPVELLTKPPVMQISLNGHELDRFVPPTGRFKRAYDVPADFQRERPDSLVLLETSATATAPGDPRSLGFSLVSVAWTPEP